MTPPGSSSHGGRAPGGGGIDVDPNCGMCMMGCEHMTKTDEVQIMCKCDYHIMALSIL